MKLPKKIKFTFLGYDFLIQPTYFSNLRFTPQKSSEMTEPDTWQYRQNMDKRIYALCGDHRLIEYVFRDLDISFLTYGRDVSTILSRVMQGFSDIRIKLINAGATNHHLKTYDNKIHEQFNILLNSVYNNAIRESQYMSIYNEIKNYDIKNYHVNETNEILKNNNS